MTSGVEKREDLRLARVKNIKHIYDYLEQRTEEIYDYQEWREQRGYMIISSRKHRGYMIIYRVENRENI